MGEGSDLNAVAVLLASFGIALAIFSAGAIMLVVERRARAARLRAAVSRRSSRVTGAGGNAASPAKSEQRNQALQAGMLALMRNSTQKFGLLKERQLRDIRGALVAAGYRQRDAIVVYTFFKLVAPVVFLAGAALYVFGLDPIGRGPMVDAAAVVAAALFGSKLPDIILTNARQKRLESVRKALPDALDMLVICAEAGLASDAALKRVVFEISRNASVLGDELHQTALELSFLPERRQALENLAARVPLPAVQAFTSTMIQAEKYGTPLARAYKVLSQEQRTERMLRAEEKAGRLPATMTVPMMLFILPALFVVLIGPAVLSMLDNFIGM